jgi:hypothetical protein
VLLSLFAPGAPLVDRAAEEETEREAALEDRRTRRQDSTRATDSKPLAADMESAASPAPPSLIDPSRRPTIMRASQPAVQSHNRSEARDTPSARPTAEATPAHDPAPAEPTAHGEKTLDSRDRSPPALQPVSKIAPATRQADTTIIPFEPQPTLELPQPDQSAIPQALVTSALTLLVRANQATASTPPPIQPTMIRPVERDRAKPSDRETREQAMPSTQSPTQHIHVSIGRIEVRASMPPPQPTPRPTTPSAPKMSLDDYLRSQNGERR